jgi:cytochrome c-type biogenesis protein CcmH/NrfG
MSFWRKEVIEPILDADMRRVMAEQLEWIAREPGNARPYYHLAQLYRTQMRQDEALGLLLEAVRLDEGHAEAHVSLAEIYCVRDDARAAWRHARLAAEAGNGNAVALLERHGVVDPSLE